MQSRDRLAAPRCDLFERLLEIAEVSIFQQLPDAITPAQVQVALTSLWELRQELVAEAKANRFHFAAATGSRHRCADAAYQHACYRLKFLSQLPKGRQPAQQLITREGIVIDLEEKIQTSTQETDLGTEDTPPDRRNTG
jgi:hypothetical protein